MFADGHGFGLTHLRVPQRRLLALTELMAANTTAQIADLVSTVGLSDRQVLLTGLPVQCAARVDAC
jgi:hypothetical protein